MAIQARFYVREITKWPGGGHRDGYADPAPIVKVALSPVSGAKGEANKLWASATPQGDITMTIGNPVAAEWFESMLGRPVAVTFTPADDVV
jgi:hypothetical protein